MTLQELFSILAFCTTYFYGYIKYSNARDYEFIFYSSVEKKIYAWFRNFVLTTWDIMLLVLAVYMIESTLGIGEGLVDIPNHLIYLAILAISMMMKESIPTSVVNIELWRRMFAHIKIKRYKKSVGKRLQLAFTHKRQNLTKVWFLLIIKTLVYIISVYGYLHYAKVEAVLVITVVALVTLNHLFDRFRTENFKDMIYYRSSKMKNTDVVGRDFKIVDRIKGFDIMVSKTMTILGPSIYTSEKKRNTYVITNNSEFVYILSIPVNKLVELTDFDKFQLEVYGSVHKGEFERALELYLEFFTSNPYIFEKALEKDSMEYMKSLFLDDSWDEEEFRKSFERINLRLVKMKESGMEKGTPKS